MKRGERREERMRVMGDRLQSLRNWGFHLRAKKGGRPLSRRIMMIQEGAPGGFAGLGIKVAYNRLIYYSISHIVHSPSS